MNEKDNTIELRKALGKVVAKAWKDQHFKAQLLADTNGILAAEGVELPSGVTFKALEETENVRYFVIPAKPNALSEMELLQAAFGASVEKENPSETSDTDTCQRTLQHD